MSFISNLFKKHQLRQLVQNKEVEQAEQELKVLRYDIKRAWKFLRKNLQSYFRGQNYIPLYLLLGPAESGKTTILAQSNLNLIDIDKQPLKKQASSKYCTWWFSPSAVFLDTAGSQTLPEFEKPRDTYVWQGFLQLIQKHLGKDPLNGIIVVLDLPNLANDKNLLQQTALSVRDRIHEIAKYFPNLPLYVIFSKCDQIAGFNEFFSELNAKERAQAFGISFIKQNNSFDAPELFNEKYTGLMQLLAGQLIQRLHQENQNAVRAKIANFPEQFAQLQNPIEEFIHKLPYQMHIKLAGIYFVSSIQQGRTVDLIKPLLTNNLQLQEKTQYQAEIQSNHSFFVEQLFSKIITPLPKNAPNKKNSLHASFYFGLFLAGLILIGGGYFCFRSYQENIRTFAQIQSALTNRAELINPVKIKTITEQLDRVATKPWIKYGFDQIQPLNAQFKQLYQTANAKNFAQNLKQILESELGIEMFGASPRKLYGTLKVYLMLADPKKLDPVFVKDWFSNYFEIKYPHALEKQLKLLTDLNWVLHKGIAINTDQRLINLTRNSLKNMPLAELAYIQLENNYDGQNLLFNSDRNNQIISDFEIRIPKLYTIENFNKITQTQIPNITYNLNREDWVLGENLKSALKPAELATFTNLVRKLYYENYAIAWDQALKAVTPAEVKNLNQAAQLLNALSNPNSELLQLLKLAQKNIIINAAPAEFTVAINTRLAWLSKIDVGAIQLGLADAAKSLSSITNSPDANQAAFHILIHHLDATLPNDSLRKLETLSANTPAPVQSWLHAISSDYLAALLDASQNHIKAVWIANVYPQYLQLINNKYPIFKNSKTDISFDEFHKFFGPDGVLESFFTSYLKPFVDNEQMYWVWKDIDGQKINLSQESLEIFIRGALIQKMFYPNKSKILLTKFTLIPAAMTPTTKGLNLDLDGQKFYLLSGQKKANHLLWPGPKPGLVTLEFASQNNQHYIISQAGAWAWFRLLDKANLRSTGTAEHYELTFDINGNAIKYDLIAESAISPFIPGIMSDFRCSEKL
ncbi:MAG: type VI secretion system membrane subunit TssM [Gammaproteobacteria bacterium]|nr:type VI secretion system membrane subunit TssM [Gammaproteobacteria bacterium]